MNRIPFSVYDFFGYLASGFLLLAALDFSLGGKWLLKENLGVVFGLFWTVLAYVLGHIVANVAGHLLEKCFVRGTLRSPEELLFQEKKQGGWARIFPGFYEPLPRKTQERILSKARQRAGIETPGRALFFHCHPVVKREPATLERLNTFLNLYGFCRNVSMASVVTIPMLLSGAIWDWHVGIGDPTYKLYWGVVAIVVAIGMLYRYLKFFRHYTVEVFVSYAELD
jgi:hypothetical protein